MLNKLWDYQITGSLTEMEETWTSQLDEQMAGTTSIQMLTQWKEFQLVGDSICTRDKKNQVI